VGRQVRDGSFMFAGNTQSFGIGKTDYFLVRVPPDGYSCPQITGTSSAWRSVNWTSIDTVPSIKNKRLVVSPRPSTCVPVNTKCVVTDACLSADGAVIEGQPVLSPIPRHIRQPWLDSGWEPGVYKDYRRRKVFELR